VSKSKINFPVVIILMTVLLDSMGIGIMIPVMPELFKSVLPNSTTADASVWAGALASIFALMQFLFGPLLGTLSDRVGRKPVILISVIVMVWYYLIMAVAQTVWLLLIGRIVGGNYGGDTCHGLGLCGRYFHLRRKGCALWACWSGIWHGFCFRAGFGRPIG
jgi:DHA1 family tetracycline resistance protein-like MFS transporter